MQHLSYEQIHGLLTAAKRGRDRDWLMILVGFCHGFRATEVVELTPACIADGFITVQRLKGSEKTTQPLVVSDDPLMDEATALILFIAGMHPNQRIFPVTRIHFWRLVRKYSAEAGIPKHLGHPHILKHSIAMQTIKIAGIENVRVYLGHKSLASTGAYLVVDDAAASAAVAASFPAKKPV
jgi:integrase